MNAYTEVKLILRTEQKRIPRPIVERLVAEHEALRHRYTELLQRQVVNERTEHYQTSTSTYRQ